MKPVAYTSNHQSCDADGTPFAPISTYKVLPIISNLKLGKPILALSFNPVAPISVIDMLSGLSPTDTKSL